MRVKDMSLFIAGACFTVLRDYFSCFNVFDCSQGFIKSKIALPTTSILIDFLNLYLKIIKNLNRKVIVFTNDHF